MISRIFDLAPKDFDYFLDEDKRFAWFGEELSAKNSDWWIF
jgi:hypothetical protein